MASFGHDGRSIARALGRSAQSVRVKAVELGVSLRKPSPIMDASNCHQRLGAACSSPRPIARSTRCNAAGSTMGGRSALECKPPPVSLADAFTPRLTGMLLNAQLAGSSLSYLQGNASIRASLTTP